MAVPIAPNMSGQLEPGGRNIALSVWTTLANNADRLLIVGSFLLAWELSTDLGWISGQLAPPPSAIGRALGQMAQSGELWSDLAASLARVTIGFALATVAGISLGIACAQWAFAARIVVPLVELLRPISVIAWIPLAILWFGLGDRPAWFLIFLGSFFPIFTNTYVGAQSIDPVFVNVARCVGASRLLYVRKVLLPSVVPYVVAGMRVGLGVGWMCVIAAELIAAQSGLGYMIQIARTMLDTERVMAGMLIIGLAGFAMNTLMLIAERRFMRWKVH
jgi:NitT/TauT family transport system permease protein/sulfonate transport system permease protein